MSRADELRVAYETLEAGPLRLRVLDDHSLVAAEHAAIPDLLAVVRAASKHTEDCCRTDIGWREQMRSHDTLASALAAFEAGGREA